MRDETDWTRSIPWRSSVTDGRYSRAKGAPQGDGVYQGPGTVDEAFVARRLG
jgi:hypothetical protein